MFPVSFNVDEDPGLKTGRLLHKVTSPVVSAFEHVGLTHVSEDPVSIDSFTGCGGVPMETKFCEWQKSYKVIKKTYS